MSHALLSPSAASRWIACTPSARLEAQMPESTSLAAEEGSLAHELCEGLLRWYNQELTATQWKVKKEAIQAHRLYTNEMGVYASDFAGMVQETFEAMPAGSEMFLETRLDLGLWAPESFGTADVLLVGGKKIHLIDLKYGKGVPVFAENNKQLMLYALGAISAFDLLYDLEEVEMSIHQPRLDSYTTFKMSVADLEQWGRDELLDKAAHAFAGTGDLAAGKHCRFCKVAGSCKALAAHNLAIVAEDFTDPKLLEDGHIAAILANADGIRKWLTAVEAAALDAAVAGKQWPGLKLVEGRSNRKITDTVAAGKALEGAGYKAHMIYTEPTLLGITTLEKAVGKKEFNGIVGPFLTKPAGAPTLVDCSDKREEWSPNRIAADDFN